MKQQLDGLVSELVKDSVSSQVNGAVLKALKQVDFQRLVSRAVKDHLKKSLNDLTFPTGSISADAINFDDYPTTYKNFTSTGIDDRSNSVQLSILDNNVVVEKNLVAKNITLQENIDVAGRVKAKNISITESALFHQGALVLGKFSTQGENEFKGPTKFLNSVDVTFNDGQIPHGAINWSGFKIPQAQVQSGKIENFNSTGIQDSAEKTELNVSKNLVSVNNKLTSESLDTLSLTVSGQSNLKDIDSEIINAQTITIGQAMVGKDLHVGGNVTVQNDLDVKGKITLPDNVKNDLVLYMNEKIKLDNIIPEGGSLTIGKRVVLEEQSLGSTVIDSNLRKVGTLRELVVAGETSLASSVYFSTLGRVGVNTDEPTMPLDVWDDGVQVTIGKNKAKTGWVGTGRDHALELGVNREPKITITPSATIIKNPVLNDRTYTQGPDIPGINGAPGDIHWNTSPKLGKPVGWVCLGNTRWAKFGEIE